MLIPMINRYELIESLPKGGIVAEIGVWNGELSQAILELTQPSSLYLIDSWGPTEDPKYKVDPAYANIDDGEKSYRLVLSKFEKQIQTGQVHTIRSLSGECNHLFKDNFFDWIYIDADHTREGCSKDLNLYSKKVKDDGFILGHDYTKGQSFGWDFGVIEAVDDWIKENKAQFLALTLSEGFPTYLLSKSYTERADRLLWNIVKNSRFTLEIDDITDFNFSHEIMDGFRFKTVLSKLKRK